MSNIYNKMRTINVYLLLRMLMLIQDLRQLSAPQSFFLRNHWITSHKPLHCSTFAFAHSQITLCLFGINYFERYMKGYNSEESVVEEHRHTHTPPVTTARETLKRICLKPSQAVVHVLKLFLSNNVSFK